MARTTYLDPLTAKEILVVLSHLELGENHLRQFLSEQEFEQLISRQSLDSPLEGKLNTDQPEIAGKVMWAINTIFSAMLGIWTGLNGFLGVNSSGLRIFTVLVTASLFGTFVAYLDYQLTRAQAKKALNRRKLQELQMDLLKRLEGERRREIEEKKREFQNYLQELHREVSEGQRMKIPLFDSALKTDSSDYVGLEWIQKLDALIETYRSFYPSQPIYEIFAQEIEKSKELLKNSLSAPLPPEEKEQRKQEPTSLLRKITLQEIKKTGKRASWVQSNLKSILTSAVPTLFGGFSSTFVYFSNMPKLAEKFGQLEIAALLTHPETKKIELLSGICITFYFALSFLYVNYKGFTRNRDLEVMEETLVQQKNRLHKLDDDLLKIKEAQGHMMKLTAVFKNLQQLTPLITADNSR